MESKQRRWYIDSGCSRHMTGHKEFFLNLKPKHEGDVQFADGTKAQIKGIGSVGKTSKNLIQNVLLVDALAHNLLSVSQFCDNGMHVLFDKDKVQVYDPISKTIKLVANRSGNTYILDLNDLDDNDMTCLVTLNDDKWLWHKRLGHVGMNTLGTLASRDIIRGLPKIKYDKDKTCDFCTQGKQVRSSFTHVNEVATKRCLELIHMDLFGPSRTTSYGGKRYVFVLVDDYSRFAWVYFLRSKDETFEKFRHFVKLVQNEKSLNITSIRSDHGGEFKNENFETFCSHHGISHNFSCARTPQQNGVVERKNRSLQEMARTIMIENKVPKHFWSEAINTSCYIQNRVFLRPILKVTPYELYNERKPNVSYFHVFGCDCFVLNTKDNLDKFAPKSDHAIFLGYSSMSKAFRVYNKRTLTIEESINVTFKEFSQDLGEQVHGKAHEEHTLEGDFEALDLNASNNGQDNTNPHGFEFFEEVAKPTTCMANL